MVWIVPGCGELEVKCQKERSERVALRELGVALDAVASDEFLFGMGFAVVGYLGILRLRRDCTKSNAALLAIAGSSLALIHVYLGRRLWLDLAMASVLVGVAVRTRSPIGALVAGMIAAFSVIARTGVDLPLIVAGLGALLLMTTPRTVDFLSQRLEEIGGSRGALLTAVGLWATVPDTNLPRVLLGATVGVTVLSHREAPARVGPMAVGVWIVIVAWIGMQGGELRPASVIGAWGTLGTLLVPGPRLPHRAALATHAAMVLAASRFAGLGPSIPMAAGIVGVSVAVAIGVRRSWSALQNRLRRIRSSP